MRPVWGAKVPGGAAEVLAVQVSRHCSSNVLAHLKFECTAVEMKLLKSFATVGTFSLLCFVEALPVEIAKT